MRCLLPVAAFVRIVAREEGKESHGNMDSVDKPKGPFAARRTERGHAWLGGPGVVHEGATARCVDVGGVFSRKHIKLLALLLPSRLKAPSLAGWTADATVSQPITNEVTMCRFKVDEVQTRICIVPREFRSHLR